MYSVCLYSLLHVCTCIFTHPLHMPHTLTAHVPDRDPGEDVDGDEPDWPLFEEVCELRSGVRFSCQVSRCGREGGKEGGAERRTRGREMLPTLAVGWRASVVRGDEAGRFRGRRF